MTKIINTYKGVILLFLALVLVGLAYDNQIKILEENTNTNQVTYYEK